MMNINVEINQLFGAISISINQIVYTKLIEDLETNHDDDLYNEILRKLFKDEV